MSTKNTRLMLLGALGILCILFITVIFAGSSILGSKSNKLVDLKLQSTVLDGQLISLAQAKKDVSQYAYFNDIATTVIPNDKDQAQTVLDIFHFADQSGILIQNVTFPASTLGVGSSSTSSTNTKVISQAKPVQGISGLYSLQLNISPLTGVTQIPNNKRVTYDKFLDFLSRIENNRRTAQVNQISIQPFNDTSGPTQFINFTLTINIFIKP